MKPVFSQDDLTIVNMEGTLTEETSRAEGEELAFKGDADFADNLVEGSVAAANLANNHTYDYGDKSYTDTIDALDKVGSPTFGSVSYTQLPRQRRLLTAQTYTGG